MFSKSFIILAAIAATNTAIAAEPTASPYQREVVITGKAPAGVTLSYTLYFTSYTEFTPVEFSGKLINVPKKTKVSRPVRVDRKTGAYEIRFNTHLASETIGSANLEYARLSANIRGYRTDTIMIHPQDVAVNRRNQRIASLEEIQAVEIEKVTILEKELVQNVIEDDSNQTRSHLSLKYKFEGSDKDAERNDVRIPTTNGKTEARFDLVLKN